MRIPLSDGEKLLLNHDGAVLQYQIRRTIGDGANCVVYEALRGDGALCRIKECYPYHDQITRQGRKLLWEEEEQRQSAFRKMRQAHDVLVKLRNDEHVGNEITGAELFEGNGTLYSVMELNHGTSFQNDSSADLRQILEVIRVLAETVAELHKLGYLHLDIKPDNFLVSYKPSVRIWLYDLDSLTAMEDVQEGNAHGLSYSQRWAAPEQRLGNRHKISPATDVYAIGTVLFEKIMGRPVVNEDCGLFANWEFDENIFNDVNPKIKRYLRCIFRHTLCANCDRRYQNADELAKILGETCNIAIEGKPFLVSNCPQLVTDFIGREDELNKITENFQAGKRTVFIQGEGGLGKSTLAIAYGNRKAKEYDAVLFFRYRTSLEEMLDDIDVQNFDGDAGEKRKNLKLLLDSHVLFIVDNFDREVDSDDFLQDLLQYKAKFLFTTRTDFSGALPGTAQIQIHALPDNELLQLFANHSGITVSELEHNDAVSNLISYVEGNTYVIEMFAKQVRASDCTPEKLYRQLCDDGMQSMEQNEKITVSKDGKIQKKNIVAILKKLFDIANLNEERQLVLRNLFLLRCLKITREDYCNFAMANQSESNAINDLKELGWIREDPHTKVYSLHPLLEDLIQEYYTPNEENCPVFFQNIRCKMESAFEEPDLFADMDEYRAKHDLKFIYSFLAKLDFNKEFYRKFALSWLLRLTLDENAGPANPGSPLVLKTFCKFDQYLLSSNVEADEAFWIQFVMFIAWILRSTFIISNEERNAAEEKKNREVRMRYDYLINLLQRLDEPEATEYRTILFQKIANCGSGFSVSDESTKRFILERYYEWPEITDYDWYDKEKYGIPLTEEDRQEKLKFDVRMRNDTSEEEESEDVSLSFMHSDDQVKFLTDYIHREDIPRIQRAENISSCMDELFNDLWREDWAKMLELVLLENKFLNPNEFKNLSPQDNDRLVECASYNNAHFIIVQAGLGDFNNFKRYFDIFFDIEEDYEDDCWKSDQNSWWVMSRYDSRHNRTFLITISSLGMLRLHWLAIPYLERKIRRIKEYAEKNNFYDKDILLGYYQEMIEYAEEAAIEEQIPDEYQRDFLGMVKEYQEKIRQLSGITYNLKEE